jgi:arylsulfatase A-like enzyme
MINDKKIRNRVEMIPQGRQPGNQKGSGNMAHKKPHIIIFNPDQWRGDILGHLGNPAAVTPNLDRLVETDGASFRNAFVQNPICTPSRCSFMSGWYPHVHGHRTLSHMMQPDEPVLLRDLKNTGYFVWWGGKNDLINPENGYGHYCDVKYRPQSSSGRPLWPNLHSWDEWRGSPQGDNYYSFYYGKIDVPKGEPYIYDGDWALIEGAIEFIRNAPPDQPLCIYLALGYPHPPFAVEDPWYSQIDRELIPPRIPTPTSWDTHPSMMKAIYDQQGLKNWSEERFSEMIATYYGMCARVDAQFGMLVKAIQDVGMYDDAAIFTFSDHGEFAGNYGLVEKTQNTFQDCLTRVPFIVKPPAGTPIVPGVRDALVELIDMRATVEALTGLEPGYTHFGRSLLPVIADLHLPHRDAVFCEGGRLKEESHCMERESIPEDGPSSLYWPRLVTQASEGPEHTKAVMCRTETHKYVVRLYEKDELYDLLADPQELHNRIDDPAYAGILARMKERLLRFFLETGDVVPFRIDKRE